MDHNLLAASALSLAGAIAAGLGANHADRELRRRRPPRPTAWKDWPPSTHPLGAAAHTLLCLIPEHWRGDFPGGRGQAFALYAALAAAWWLAFLGFAFLGRAVGAP